MKKHINKLSVATGVLMVAGSAMADTSAVETAATTAIAAAVVTVGVIGAAKVGLTLALKAIAWVQRALS